MSMENQFPNKYKLHNNEVHLWLASMNQEPYVYKSLLQTLTVDELSRAEKLYYEHDRRQKIICRGILRGILSRYCETQPKCLKFSYNKFGKPELDNKTQDVDIKFNLSHSGDYVVYAFALNKDLGIDLEKVRQISEMDEIINNQFSYLESELLNSIPSESRLDAFFQCWTLKEAYLKAKGLGLSIELNKFSVSFSAEFRH